MEDGLPPLIQHLSEQSESRIRNGWQLTMEDTKWQADRQLKNTWNEEMVTTI